jgi:hypothetical protein
LEPKSGFTDKEKLGQQQFTKKRAPRMIKSASAWIVALFLFGVAGRATAASLAPAFDQFCLAQDSTATEVETQARAQGYVAPPPQLLGTVPAPFQSSSMLWKAAEGSAVFLIVTEKVAGTTPYPAKLCAMALVPGSESDVSDFEKMIGFSPVKTSGPEMYLFKEAGGRRIPAPAAEAAPSELRKGNNVVAAGAHQGDMTVFMVARPLRPTPPSR